MKLTSRIDESDVTSFGGVVGRVATLTFVLVICCLSAAQEKTTEWRFGYAGVCLFAFVWCLFALREFLQKPDQKLYEVNNHVVKLERFIYGDIMNYLDPESMKRFAIYVVDKYMSHEDNGLPENFPELLCAYRKNHAILEGAISEKIKFLAELQGKEVSEGCNVKRLDDLSTKMLRLNKLLAVVQEANPVHKEFYP